MEDNEGHGESACEDLGWWKPAGHCRDWEVLRWELPHGAKEGAVG